MKKENALLLILDDIYYTIEDLRFNKKFGIMLSKDELSEFLSIKDALIDDETDFIKKLPLKTFNSKHCFFVKSSYILSLLSDYLSINILDFELNQNFLFDRNLEDILISRLFSEIEGTLSIENVPTTHKRIVEIREKENLTDKNDIIIKNMYNAIEYIVKEKPTFNKENLLKLYNILSNNCLPNNLKLKDNCYYRDDMVYIDIFEGADPSIINECMDSLFEFANNPSYIKEYSQLLPFICHYYILYIHPYFDYNGRTARMVSFWINYIYDIPVASYFMSEAINESKNEYYKALKNTRLTNNDLTYFLGYILETSIKYSFVYKNLEEIKNALSKTGDALTSTEWVYVKKIIIHNPDEFFNYKTFLKYINSTMTKQGATKILNHLSDYEILIKSQNKKGDIVYKLNQDFIVYMYNK